MLKSKISYDYDHCGQYDEDESYSDYQDAPCQSSSHKRTNDDCEKDQAKSSKATDSSESSGRFSGLAKRFRSIEHYDKSVDADLAANINELFKIGMEEEQYTNMVKDETTPHSSNCESLVTVKLNGLVWNIVSPSARSWDKKLQILETTIVKSARILANTVDKAAKMQKETAMAWKEGCELNSLIDDFNDSLALLGQ